MRSGITLLVALALGGCASTPKPTPDPAELALKRSAAEVSRSITDLAEVEQYDRFRRMPAQPRVYDQVQDMEQVVSMEWDGPIETVVRRLAAESGYTAKVIGRAPVIPVLVRLTGSPATVSDHLRNVGYQAGARADVTIYTDRKIVELSYNDAGF
ncbi:DotD/TraH family lipoprotein [Xanthomonas euvesicatoria]